MEILVLYTHIKPPTKDVNCALKSIWNPHIKIKLFSKFKKRKKM